MNHASASGSLDGITLYAGLEYHSIIDFDRKGLRRAMKAGGGLVRKEARRLLSRRAVSGAGEVPGMQSGQLRAAIGVVSRGSKGGWVKIGPRSIPGSVFYPAFLYYGSPKTGLEKRANFMEQALQNRRADVKRVIRAGLDNSLVPR